VAFLALSEVAPVTHAVGNTIKRVVIILASVIVFQNPLSPLGALGSAIAVGGCVTTAQQLPNQLIILSVCTPNIVSIVVWYRTLLYSLAKNKYK